MYIDRDAENAVEEILSMPEQFRYGVNRVVEALKPVVSKGLKAVLLFGVPSKLPKVRIHTTSATLICVTGLRCFTCVHRLCKSVSVIMDSPAIVSLAWHCLVLKTI